MQVIDVSKVYHNKKNDVLALNHVSLTIPKTGMTFITGPSGCGKTTLIRLMAGMDSNFEGEIYRDGRVEWMNQEIVLFENMTVFDNLRLVCEDQQKMMDCLDTFGITFPHKKVKKLSIGEKKRVQMIRSLLSDASYLLCDEPTAALDGENARLVMETLKEISKKMAVIVVTHQQALLDCYASSVIRMGKGIILSQNIQDEKESRVEDQIIKRTWKQYVLFLRKTFSTRWLETMFQLVFFFLLIPMVLVVTYLFPFLDQNMQATSQWQNGKNIIVTHPTFPTTIYREDVAAWVKQVEAKQTSNIYYDLYQYEDSFLAHQQIDGLLGFKIGWNEEKYRIGLGGSSYLPRVTVKEMRVILDRFKEEHPNGTFDFYEDLVEWCETKDEHELITNYSCLYGKNEGGWMGSTPSTEATKIGSYPIVGYHLFSDARLALSTGTMPTTSSEILLTPSLAKYCMKTSHVSSQEELIGKEVYIEFLECPYGKTNFGYRSYPFVVSGITYLESMYEYQVFYVDGAFEKIFEKEFGTKTDEATYQYLHFLVDPNMDANHVAKQLDVVLESKESHFDVYQALDLKEEESYQSRFAMMVFVMFGFVCWVVGYVLFHMMTYRRYKKEIGLFLRYHYRAYFIETVKWLIMLGIIAFFQWVMLEDVCSFLNQIANSLGFMDIVETHLPTYLSTCVYTLFLVGVIEGGIYAFCIRKNQ